MPQDRSGVIDLNLYTPEGMKSVLAKLAFDPNLRVFSEQIHHLLER